MIKLIKYTKFEIDFSNESTVFHINDYLTIFLLSS